MASAPTARVIGDPRRLHAADRRRPGAWLPLSHRADPMPGVALLVETEGGVRSALIVDAIQDQRQVVIKSLEANYRPRPGHRRRDHPRRRPRRADSRHRRHRRERRRAAAIRPSQAVSGIMSWLRPRHSKANAARRIHRLPHRRAGILHRHHVGARDPRLDAGDGAAARARLSCAASSTCAASCCRSSISPTGSAFAPTEPTRAMSSSSSRSARSMVGLLVDAVSDILSQPTEWCSRRPTSARRWPGSFVLGVIAIDDRMISLIALEQRDADARREAHDAP